MIHVARGNIFNSPAQVLVNPVNTVGVMGAGLAKQFKQRYPEMYKSYRRFCLAGQFQIGMLQLYEAKDGKVVCNFPTKNHWEEASKLEHIEAGLQKFVGTYQEKGIVSVAFPKLGCGLGGLDWDQQVEPMMRKYLDDVSLSIYFYI